MDIKHILDNWPYDPERPSRVTQAADGREVLQVRLPLGIEQYELDGRPDGETPHGQESVLQYQRMRLREARRAKEADEFSLSKEECADLFEEGVLYYYRYLHLFQIQDWERTVRDTARNLYLFDFTRKYSERGEDRMYLEQWRPYIVRVNAIATAMIALRDGEHSRAMKVIGSAIRKVENLPEQDHPTFQFERQRSLLALKEMDSQLSTAQPTSDVDRLEEELQKAVQEEEYEHAAELRDRIQDLRTKGAPSS